jgi:hypothetical protein
LSSKLILASSASSRRAGHDERVDLEQRRIGRHERAIQRHHHLDGLADLIARQSEVEGELAGLKRLQTQRGIHERLEDALRASRGPPFSISTPPSWLTMTTGICVDRSMTTPDRAHG